MFFFCIFGNDYSSRYPLSRFSGVNSGPLVLSTVRVIYPYTENGYLRVSIIRNLWGSFSFSIQTPGEVFYGTDCECSNMNCPKDPDTGIVCGGVLKRCWSFSPSEWVLCFMWLTLVCLCYCNAGRGKCDCGRCNCTGNWTGPSCSCSSDTSECVKNGVRMNERTHARTRAHTFRYTDTYTRTQTSIQKN